MRKLLFLSILFFYGMLSAQQLEGSWMLIEKDGQEVIDQETVKIFQDGYFSFGSRETGNNEFIKAGGGEFTANGHYTESFDFHTENPDLVGQEKEYELELQNDRLILSGNGNERQVWKKISDREDELTGNWVITGRMRNDEIRRSTPGARRTIKILGGGRFQWVAFNSETKEFSGTGGGTYTAEDGQYIENIEFFSRDDSRVGASLEFDYEVKDGEWHHNGLSSKGDPIYEIWSPYAEAYQKP